MLFGAGNLVFVSKELATNGSIRGEELLYPPCLSSFELTGEANFLEAKCLIDGNITTVASKINEETYTMTVTTQFADWQAFQFAYDELAQTSTSVVIPTLKTGTVGAVVSGEIQDSDITAANAADILAYVSGQGAWGDKRFLKVVQAPTVPGTDEVQVDGPNNKLVLDASLDGAPVQYFVNRTYSSIETLGLESTFDEWGKLEFWGLAYGTEFGQPMLIRVPDLGRISIPSLTINGDITELTVEFRANTDTNRGFRNPFVLYDLKGGVLV